LDIIVRGGEEIIDLIDLLTLGPGQQSWVWRSPGPVSAMRGDRVYFVRAGGEIFLYATYDGYGERSAINRQGTLQSGGAILLTWPVQRINPALTIPGPWPPGPWRWRYDNWNLRQHV
jgi:hypothetical protein